ncbi:hypothetical protein IV203_029716 [Nitzschia inconspicua]|uniref:Uncharacterized protein n=1 Tax=Nitzschia inconspicua TaxID=303405 RepID=A0A9K3Q192_9STRA|nr:hypothetical protein IV203_029716 [Nitzschia inconspicua]
MAEEAEVAQTLICLNNKALGFFLEGRLTDASEVLSHAYTLFDSFRQQKSHGERHKRTLAGLHGHHNSTWQGMPDNFENHQDLPPKVPTSDTTTSTPSQLRGRLKVSMVNRKLCVAPLSFSSGESTTYSLYNRGLMLSVDPTATEGAAISTLLTSNQHQTSAILLYNMALCYHNMGSHLGVSSALLKALQLYEMALESLDQGVDLMQVQKLLMAILNNCANIYTYYRRAEETQRCFENLKLVLAALTVDMTLDEDYDFFFLNAFFQSQELWFAPAA